MAEEKPAQEPSMEEILSSIRRIIADDDDEQVDRSKESGVEAGEREAGEIVAEIAAAETDAPTEEVLELTEAVEERPEPVKRPAAAAEDDAAKGKETAEAPDVTLAPAREPLVSGDAARATEDAFARLGAAMAPAGDPASAGGPSMEQFVATLVRPMLKEWLDRNLPPMVERLVAQEIRKIARRIEPD